MLLQSTRRRLVRPLLSRGMFIQTEQTPNPASIKFVPDRPVLPAEHGPGLEFRLGQPAGDVQSPLAKRLLRIEGVSGIFLGPDFVSVTKDDSLEWQELKPLVFGSIMEFWSDDADAEVVSSAPVAPDTAVTEEDDEVVAMIKELLDTRIRPAVHEDGGDLFFNRFDEETGTVYLRLAGSCSGCPSSSVTLKNGVERMLMHYIPEVRAVEEVEEDELTLLNKAEVERLEERLASS